MTAIPKAYADLDDGFLNAGIAAADVSLTVAPIYKYISGVKTKQGFDTTAGIAMISMGSRRERVRLSGRSYNSTTSVTTYTVARGLSLTDTTGDITPGTGMVWPKGARIQVVIDEANINLSALTDQANTFAADQTMTGLVISGVGSAIRPTQVTTTQRNAMSPSEGWFVEDTTLKQYFGYLNGGWVALGTSTVTFPIAETQGGTNQTTYATGDALYASAANTLSKLAGNTSSTLKKYWQSLGTGSAGLAPTYAQVDLAAGVTGNLPVGNLNGGTSAGATTFWRGDGAWASPTTYAKPVYMGMTDSSATATNNSEAYFDVHTYTIPANDLIAGVAYEVDLSAANTHTNGTFNFVVTLGSTDVGSVGGFTATSTGFKARVIIYGTAAAGTSVAVRTEMGLTMGSTLASASTGGASVATNGTLVLKFGLNCTGVDSSVMKTCKITKVSTTAF